MPRAHLLVAPLLLALGVACGGDDGVGEPAGGGTVTTVSETSGPEPTSPSFVPAPSQPVRETTPSSSTPGTGDGVAAPSPAAEQAVADLAAREGVEPAAIEVVSQENVTWPDSSLGCPEEGMLYAQVLTDGIRIILELDGRRYEYHGGGSRPEPFYCADPRPPASD